MGRVTRAACILGAVLAALVAATAAAADVAASPCEGAGLVAIIAPGASAPVTVGPSVTAATVGTASEPATHDGQYGVDVANGEAGAAGCVRVAAPGGTHVGSDAWSVLGAVSGTSIRADLVPATGDGSGWHLRTDVEGLRVDGSAVDAIDGATVAVGSWATLTIRAQADLAKLRPLRYWAAALELRLVQAHAGLPAGTLVLIGYAAANRAPAPPVTSAPAVTTTAAPPPTTTAPPVETTPPKKKPAERPRPQSKAKPKPAVKKHTATQKRARPRPHHARPKKGMPLTSTPPLQGSGYVFPLASSASWGDSYGSARSDVPGGWHHGDDLFAPLGTPVVAVADGTVFAVGWNAVGGWRLWLADAHGNDFYYAHLSGYTALAQNDRDVRKGQVLGFVGNTGDAFTTPPHLHFEVHPNPLLYLGYDGAVDPTTYLRAWPLPEHVKTLPPVELPGAAPSGFGSVTDFRRLLAVRPLKRAPKVRPTPKALAKPAARTTGVPAPARAAATAASAHTRPRAESPLPVVFAIVLAAAALAAIAHAARDGRNP